MQNVKNRAWVKNVAIIFLAALLILTFFSNTIMNRALPEVATQGVSSGSITARVRGSGTVTAVGTYELKAEQTRKVQSVLVRSGQEVNAGDVLFVLGEGESEELEQASESLRQLELSYKRAVAGMPVYNNAQLEKERKAAKQDLDVASKAFARAESDLAEEMKKKEGSSSLDAYYKEYEKLEKELNKAQAELEDAKQQQAEAKEKAREEAQKLELEIRVYDYWESILKAKIGTEPEEEKTDDQTEGQLSDQEPGQSDGYDGDQDGDQVQGQSEDQTGAQDSVLPAAHSDSQTQEPTDGQPAAPTDGQPAAPTEEQTEKQALGSSTETKPTSLPEEDGTAEGASEDREETGPEGLSAGFRDATIRLAPAKSLRCRNTGSFRPVMRRDDMKYPVNGMTDWEKDQVEACEKELKTLLAGLQTDEEKLAKIRELRRDAQRELDAIRVQLNKETDAAVDKASDRVTAAQAALDAVLKRHGSVAERYIKARDEYAAAQKALASIEDSIKANGRSAASASIELQDLSEQIARARQKLEELSGGTENQITAPVGGIIESIGYTAGNTAPKGEILCRIQVPDMGYTLSFSVSNEQARRLHSGDTATVSNYYWGSEILATLSAIEIDPQSPQTNKRLTFDLTGDVNPGSELTISVGSRSQNYDVIIPNSAIRSDTNGSFVLKLEAKNSPLGNRYFARRVDVTVLGQDDVNAAVSGDLSWGDFVITTSDRPVSVGDQVRMTDNNG